MSTLFLVAEPEQRLAVLADTRQQCVDMLNLRRVDDQRTAQVQGAALAFGAHFGIADAVQIGDVCQADSAADQLAAAVTYGIGPYLLQKLFGIARHRQRYLASLLVAQRQEAIGKNQPKFTHILQALLPPGGGIARP